MIRDALAALKAHILEFNTYFDRGFDDVFLNEKKGYIVSGETRVFPEDTFGDYFYLRLPDSMTFSTNDVFKVSDCDSAAGGSLAITLVAIARESDPVKLMENMVYTLQRYGQDTRITSATIDSDATIIQELSKLSKDNQLTALKNWSSRNAVISVKFSITMTYQPRKKDCIVNPCTTC